MKTALFIAFFFLVAASSSADERQDKITAAKAADVSTIEVTNQFVRLHAKWMQEAKAISHSSITGDYINLPGYRAIVALGGPALPLLEQKLADGKGLDFMLAYAVVEICQWDKTEFRGGLGEQDFAAKVLKKLQSEKTTIPALSQEQQIALLKDAQGTFSRFVRGDPKTRGDTIPEELWGPAIRNLKPLRVMDDRVNIKIVLSETAEAETGLYINLPISSYFPDPGKFAELRPLDGETFGGVYQYKLLKKAN